MDVNFERTQYLTNLFNNPQGYSSELTYAMFHNQYITSYELTGDAFLEVNYERINWDDDDYYKVINGFNFIPPDLLKWYNDTEQWGYRNQPSIRYEPDEIIHIFSEHASYADHDEMRRGMYLREYTALSKLCGGVSSDGFRIKINRRGEKP